MEKINKFSYFLRAMGMTDYDKDYAQAFCNIYIFNSVFSNHLSFFLFKSSLPTRRQLRLPANNIFIKLQCLLSNEIGSILRSLFPSRRTHAPR